MAANVTQQDPQSSPAPQARRMSETVRAPRAMAERTSLSETPRQRQAIIGQSSLSDDLGLGRFGMVFADERVGAGFERGHFQLHRLPAGNHFLDPGLPHVELLGPLVLVGDDEHGRGL